MWWYMLWFSGYRDNSRRKVKTVALVLRSERQKRWIIHYFCRIEHKNIFRHFRQLKELDDVLAFVYITFDLYRRPRCLVSFVVNSTLIAHNLTHLRDVEGAISLAFCSLDSQQLSDVLVLANFALEQIWHLHDLYPRHPGQVS